MNKSFTRVTRSDSATEPRAATSARTGKLVALVLLTVCLALLFVATLPLWLKLTGETLGLSVVAWGLVKLRESDEREARALMLIPARAERTALRTRRPR